MELKPDFENTPQQQQQQQQQQEERDEKLEKSQQQQKPKPKHAFHVLAVDDSLIDRKLLEKLLRVSSYKVTCVESGDKALEYLGLLDNLENNSTASAASAFTSPHSSQQEGLTVNLIMTDFCMPGMSGYDLLKKVKGSSWKDVPVVIMSSENVPARISMCLEEGAEEFLLKPLQLSDLDKLEPHLLKSLNQNMDNNEFNGGNNENINNESSSNSNNNKNEINNFKSNNSAFSKRKALVTETQERRPKMKELAVV